MSIRAALLLVLASAFAVVALLIWPLVGDGGPEEVAVHPQNLVDAPREFIGERVSVTGEISSVHGDTALVLDDEVLVVAADVRHLADEPGIGLGVDDVVRVTGTVRRASSVNDEMPLLDSELLSEWSGRVAVIADDVDVVEVPQEAR